MSLKEFFFKISFLYRFLPLTFLMRLSGKKIILPFYHFVIEKENSLVNHLYQPKTKEQFVEDITFFKKHLISLPVSHLKKKKDTTILGFIISFDDGLSNFNHIVAPILIKEKVYAINFLNTNFIDNKKLFYRYKVNLLIDFIENNTLSTDQQLGTKELLNIDSFNFPLIVEKLKSLTIKNEGLIDELAKILNFSFVDFLQNKKPYLSKEQVLDLKKKDFLFGAHSENHPRYSLIPLDKQLEETLNSLRTLQNEFSIQENYFSFPFSDDGVSNDFFEKLKTEDIITFGTSGLKDEGLKNHYQRIPMEYDKVYSAETIVKGELIYYLLKKKFGKHRITRN